MDGPILPPIAAPVDRLPDRAQLVGESAGVLTRARRRVSARDADLHAVGPTGRLASLDNGTAWCTRSPAWAGRANRHQAAIYFPAALLLWPYRHPGRQASPYDA
jgi:hypothetical protein